MSSSDEPEEPLSVDTDGSSASLEDISNLIPEYPSRVEANNKTHDDDTDRDLGKIEPPDLEQPRSINEDWQMEKPLAASLLHLYEQELWTDVSFRCEDHTVDAGSARIKAHKNILAARSPVFQAMFYGPCADGKEEQELKTVKSEIFDLVLRYVYSEVTVLTETKALEVLKVAHMYQISGLVDYCSSYLISILNPENACRILEAALLYDLSDLADSACENIDDNAKIIMTTDGFMTTSEATLTYILKGDTFFEQETDIIKAAERWAERRLSDESRDINGQEKRKILGKGFFYLRVPTLNISQFSKYSKGKGYYTVSEMDDIIEHIVDKPNEESVACHSATRRIPRQHTLLLQSYELGDLKQTDEIDCLPMLQVKTNLTLKQTDEIDCLFMLQAKKTLTLKCIHINEIKLHAYYVNNRNQLKSELNVARFIISGFLSIENFKQKFQLSFADKWAVTLSSPVKLSSRRMPYTLNLKLQLGDGQKVAMTVQENTRRITRGFSFSTASNVYGSSAFASGSSLFTATGIRPNSESGLSVSISSVCNKDYHSGTCLAWLTKGFVADNVSCNYCNESKHGNVIKSIEICNVSARSKQTKWDA